MASNGGNNECVSKIYRELVDRFLTRREFGSNTTTLLVFKGFPLSVYQALLDNNVPYLLGEWNGKYPDYNLINAKTILSAACSFQNIVWCFYEELIALTNALNDLSVVAGSIFVVDNNIFDNYYPLPFAIKAERDDLIQQLEDETTNSKDYHSKQYYSDFRIESDAMFLSYVNRHYTIDTGVDIGEIGFYSDAKYVSSAKRNETIEISSLPIITYQLQSGMLANSNFLIYDDDSAEIRRKVSILNDLGSRFCVSFSISLAEERQNLDANKYLEILQRYWGENATFYNRVFYKNPAVDPNTIEISQGLIVSDIIKQCESAMRNERSRYSDIIVTAPTGAGKSLLFQIPGIHLHLEHKALTIVISPLVALMIDQVTELEERGVTFATYLNSAITYEERQSRIDGIINGEYSLVYLAPELLVSYDIHSLIGERKIGLMVIDEAHLVTSWGRDFRVDYWFLGDHIERLRRGNIKRQTVSRPFPVLCLTATAVYGGKDDVVGDLQNSLHLSCYSDHLYIGYVRRDNIHFQINHPSKMLKADKDEKVRLTVQAIHNFVANGQKTIVYFPYKSQIEDVLIDLQSNHPTDVSAVEKYYSGSLTSLEKNEAYQKFRDSESVVMLATKAFGMGINISDVINVYHFAPTGTLADYVQEIGRAARKLDDGYAITDYLKTDMHYARTLWGLSGLRHYQIRAIMKKLYELYSEKRHRNLLFTPDTFGFLFDQADIDLKVKSGLMLLSSDLLEKYHFRVINVRPKNLFTKQFVIVPFCIEKQFLSDYGEYCLLMDDCFPITETGRKNDTLKITKTGNVYEIDLGKLWETKFFDMTFAQFKYKFFSRELFNYSTVNIVPNIKLTITYGRGYEDAVTRLTALTTALQNTFADIKRKLGGKEFSYSEFYKTLSQNSEIKVRQEYARMLLDLFCYNFVDVTAVPSEEWKFIVRRKGDGNALSSESVFAIRTNKFAYLSRNILRYLNDSRPNINDDTYVAYLAIPKNTDKQSFQQLLASLMQLFDIASYELSGGKNPAIFVRVNDPLKLRRLVESGDDYRNSILVDIEARHKRAVEIMNKFMGDERNNNERWEIIENYFLGNDEIVDEQLGL